jgi:RHS repeat-associated protein
VTVSLSTNNASYQYDGNGNLTNDGLRCFTYDDENQLIQVWVPNNWLSQFSYDGKMRRRIRDEFTWQNSQWVLTNQVYYVYDGNNVIQERNGNNQPTTTYTRGLDLSGSLDDAGGIGGLLSMTLNNVLGPPSSNSMYYHCDANGNITALINSSQYIVAKYLYDAFGNILSAAGSLAQQNLYRFSSKEMHVNSGLSYYLYRYYDPNLQRWINRDPLTELGFERVSLWEPSSVDSKAWLTAYLPELLFSADLYEFVGNDAIVNWDARGLVESRACEEARKAHQKLQAQLQQMLAKNQEVPMEFFDKLAAAADKFNELCDENKPQPPGLYCPDPGPRQEPLTNFDPSWNLGSYCQNHPGTCLGGLVLGVIVVGVLGALTGGLGYLFLAA